MDLRRGVSPCSSNVLLGLLFALLACSPAGEEQGSCYLHEESAVDVRRDAIVGGEPDADYLALTPDEREAIVAIRVSGVNGGDQPHCTGVLLSPRLVLTAQHCIGHAPPASILIGSPRAGYWPSVEAETDAEADVALLSLAEPLTGAPLRIADASAESWLGRRVTLAGYGLNDQGSSPRLLFSTEEVTAIGEAHLTTSGFGRSGACLGDSGGPLLGRSNLGSVVVIGILARGSVTCQQEDRYRRIDSIAYFIRQRVARLPEDDGCGALTFEGRCFDGQAVWCDAGVRRSRRCDHPQGCGWDGAAQAYRCVDPKLNCAGADAFGACVGDGVRRCTSEGDEHSPCNSCQRCGFDARTGRAACYPR